MDLREIYENVVDKAEATAIAIAEAEAKTKVSVNKSSDSIINDLNSMTNIMNQQIKINS